MKLSLGILSLILVPILINCSQREEKSPQRNPDGVVAELDSARAAADSEGLEPGQANEVRLAGNGLRGRYYGNIYFAGNPVERLDPQIDFDWGRSSPIPGLASDQYSVRWTGELSVPMRGEYSFVTSSDDGVKLYLNDELIIDNLIPQKLQERSSKNVILETGRRYSLRLEYVEHSGQAVVKLDWLRPDGIRERVPQASLTTEMPDRSGEQCSAEQLAFMGSQPLHKSTENLVRPYPAGKLRVGVAIENSRMQLLDGYAQTFDQFNVLGTNSVQWNIVEGTRGTRGYRNADRLIGFAGRDVAVKAHAIVYPAFLPKWIATTIKNENGTQNITLHMNKAEYKRSLAEHVDDLLGHYHGEGAPAAVRNKIFSWDVINEAFGRDNALLMMYLEAQGKTIRTASAEEKRIAEAEYVMDTFEMAHDKLLGLGVRDQVILCYNDNNIQSLIKDPQGKEPRTKTVLAGLQRVIAKWRDPGYKSGRYSQRLPIDCLGSQVHTGTSASNRNADAGATGAVNPSDDGESSINPDTVGAEFARAMQGFIDLGLSISITEMDVSVKNKMKIDGDEVVLSIAPGSSNKQIEAYRREIDVQRRIYRSYSQACRDIPQCFMIMTWGLEDGHTWLEHNIFPDRRNTYPLLYTARNAAGVYQEKPTFCGVMEGLLACRAQEVPARCQNPADVYRLNP